MDKIAANNHFVSMQKEIKKAKAMVSGNLIRRINKLKEDRDRHPDDENHVSKVNGKIDKILTDVKLLKKIDPYLIAKSATLKPDHNHWDRLMNDCNASAEDVLIAKVICKNNISKQVNKFRNDHKDCDEWLNEYIEYREKKKEILKQDFKPTKKKNQSKDKKFTKHEKRNDNRKFGKKTPNKISQHT